jgi:pyridoxamine 5'-phosphate oxidase
MKLDQMKCKFSEGKVPLPDNWGGYRIVPDTFEFWQGRLNRLHDRFIYRLNVKGGWSVERLAP